MNICILTCEPLVLIRDRKVGLKHVRRCLNGLECRRIELSSLLLAEDLRLYWLHEGRRSKLYLGGIGWIRSKDIRGLNRFECELIGLDRLSGLTDRPKLGLGWKRRVCLGLRKLRCGSSAERIGWRVLIIEGILLARRLGWPGESVCLLGDWFEWQGCLLRLGRRSERVCRLLVCLHEIYWSGLERRSYRWMRYCASARPG